MGIVKVSQFRFGIGADKERIFFVIHDVFFLFYAIKLQKKSLFFKGLTSFLFVGNQETSLGNMVCPDTLIFVLLTRKGCILCIINFKIILLWQ